MNKAYQECLDQGRMLRQEMRSHGYYLIVEDSQETVAFFRALTRQSGVRLVSAGTADEALQIIEKEQNEIQCVIIDLNLPDSAGMGGERVVQYIESKRTGIPYVVHTADPSLAQRVARKYPRASVLLKGAAVSEIRAMLGIA